MRILLVEDDETLGELTEHQLVRRFHVVDWLKNGNEARQAMESGRYDVYIFDWMLPGASGMELTREARNQNDHTPVLLLTARDAVKDRVAGLSAGADDYMIKPFAFEELEARLIALFRRQERGIRSDVIQAGDLKVHLYRYEVSRGEDVISLNRREFQLLVCLMRHAGQVLTRDQLLDQVWGIGAEVTLNTVDSTVKLLRKKVDGPYSSKYIQSVYGAGYRLLTNGGGPDV
ncbi:DNA-binding response regulator, OmpR family, contains REC and winged-helix (wHTH) domain [Paenibacillus catalpae]|uniref:DNA-binding response regulator, OmpR family, contains REC and winged-helix (WHTH) domain n=1 Tax=Paenibacillus catalpae TaxID=1045775 RepID=A0A1I1VAX4_9BACL|nr:response regulator transcription factor [Paenibacillus catalpae]SFD78253.1 DNA-binding response regulator, OmpR family, contains REC and winged-helix (wHTH) domain [Paenibacillus catalpae]